MLIIAVVWNEDYARQVGSHAEMVVTYIDGYAVAYALAQSDKVVSIKLRRMDGILSGYSDIGWDIPKRVVTE